MEEMDSLKSFVSNYCSGFEPGRLFAAAHSVQEVSIGSIPTARSV